MTQWDYRYIVADRDEVFKINDVIIDRMNLSQHLKQAGNDGWELVGIAAEGVPGYWRLVFKRRSQAEEHQELSALGQIVRKMTQVVTQQTQIADLLNRLVQK
jgi:hypothetical protein